MQGADSWAGSLFSPRTDSVTVWGAAWFYCHLDRALQTALNWPRKSCLVFGQKFQGKWTTSCLESCCIMTNEWTLIKEGKNRSSWWVKGRVVSSAVMEELKVEKAPMLRFLLTHGQWAMAWPCGHIKRKWKPALLKECPCEVQPYRNLRTHWLPEEFSSRFRKWLALINRYSYVLPWNGHFGPWNEWIWVYFNNAEISCI